MFAVLFFILHFQETLKGVNGILFSFSTVAVHLLWFLKICTFCRVGSGRPMCISIPNIIEISQMVIFRCHTFSVFHESERDILHVVGDGGYLSSRLVGSVAAQWTGAECEHCSVGTLDACHPRVSVPRPLTAVTQTYSVLYVLLTAHNKPLWATPILTITLTVTQMHWI